MPQYQYRLVTGDVRVCVLSRSTHVLAPTRVFAPTRVYTITTLLCLQVPRGGGSIKLITELDEEGDEVEAESGEEEDAEDTEDPTRSGVSESKADSAPSSTRKGKAEKSKGKGRKSKGGAGAAGGEGPTSITALKNNVDRYRGLSVHVAFTDAGQSQNMTQLSGGQRTLVALALIFAIQRTDPAPFYLFDEVDSALDGVHRAAVANLIRSQAHDTGAQFLATTFRPELVDAADKWFGVDQSHKVSTITERSQKETHAFIVALMEEEARGGGSSGAGTSALTSTGKFTTPGGSAITSASGSAARSAPASAARTSASGSGARSAKKARIEEEEEEE